MDKNEKSKKQVPLRLSPALYDRIAAWAEDDFRSVNGQIEFLLTESVKKRYGRNALNNDEEEKTK
ncbi:MAG: Arc family DNA-binding protein [Oscillospiraceae bacterium]|nr:Arc family DNA-binding protein [Oscillospiraceae bacterium]